MSRIANEIISKMKVVGTEEQATHLMRFFKTGKGDYGEGDMFLGLKVPQTRELVKDYQKAADLEDIDVLVHSQWHEARLAGFLMLIGLYKKAKDRRLLIDYYLSVLDCGNNWDLVDVIAPKLLGDWLVRHPEERGLLYELAAMDGQLWHQRVAVVSCWPIIRSGSFDDTLKLAEKLLNHPHDLIHKATGWMLREVGKRGGLNHLLEFLDRHAHTMPRTMLRYAIEQLPIDQRQYYMKVGKNILQTKPENV